MNIKKGSSERLELPFQRYKFKKLDPESGVIFKKRIFKIASFC